MSNRNDTKRQLEDGVLVSKPIDPSSVGEVLKLRSVAEPYVRHLEPDFPIDEVSAKHPLNVLHGLLPKPLMHDGPDGHVHCVPQWNSVALFYNLADSHPNDYQSTDVTDVLAWFDEGGETLNPGISEFLCNYWNTLTLGNLAFGINTPRNSEATPLIPTVDAPDGNPQDWGGLIRRCLEANHEAVWQAAGGLIHDGKRWVPSIVLVQHYWTHASAGFGGFEHTVDGNTYLIGDVTHIAYSLDTWSPPDAPEKVGRHWWGTLCHEYGHNFVEFGDLYGPQGCTGYWDLLGDNAPPGRMSEVSSGLKERKGWLTFKRVIEGPTVPKTSLTLRPYTTTGEAFKVVPDPTHTPHEYFLLEFRKSTGTEVWRPDGALPEKGLFIIHINERLGVPGTWLLREAPYFDPEFADGSHGGATDWTGHDDLIGKVFPQGSRNAFTPYTVPSSNFYGRRSSGLSVTDITSNDDEVHFNLRINRPSTSVGWQVTANDRALAGRFTPESHQEGMELFMRNQDDAALFIHRQAQWMVARRQNDWIGEWNLGSDNRELVGDLDGDGLDEIYIRSPEWAGVLKWRRSRFDTVTVQHDWIDEWNLGADNWECVCDLDGDGRDEVYIRSPEWAGVMKLVGDRLRLLSIQHDWLDNWNLGRDNQEFVGRFRDRNRDEIMIRSPDWMGLLAWRSDISKLQLVSIQHDWIDDWNMGPSDQHFIGDFDGDGLDEIYIRSAHWAGVLKWVGGRFRVLWMAQERLEHVDDNPDHSQSLQERDLNYSGKFRKDRAAILHRDTSGVSLLIWTGHEMRVRHRLNSWFGGHWNLGSSDKFVLGDFHKIGADAVDAPFDYVTDNLTDVFIHNNWGTGMLGFNHLNDDTDQAGLTWIQGGFLLYD